MAENRCPRCFNKISDFATSEEAQWTDDPIKTPKGEAGIDYIGFTYIKPAHIEEIQQARQQQEDQLGFMTIDETGYVEGESILKTIFSPVRIEGKKVHFYKKYLRELRESTEKILNVMGLSKEDYFNYDEEGIEYNIGNHQLDWHDPDLSKKFLDIKAVHIEDLRHLFLRLPDSIPILQDSESTYDTSLTGYTFIREGWYQTLAGFWRWDLYWSEPLQVWRWYLTYKWYKLYTAWRYYYTTFHEWNYIPQYFIDEWSNRFAVGLIKTEPTGVLRWTKSQYQEFNRIHNSKIPLSYLIYGGENGGKTEYWESPTYPEHMNDGTIYHTHIYSTGEYRDPPEWASPNVYVGETEVILHEEEWLGYDWGYLKRKS